MINRRKNKGKKRDKGWKIQRKRKEEQNQIREVKEEDIEG